MVCRFSIRRVPVVAGSARTIDEAVVRLGGRPAVCGMANLAVARGSDMVCGFSGCRGPVVTGTAGAADQTMVHLGRRPAIGRMASLTVA